MFKHKKASTTSTRKLRLDQTIRLKTGQQMLPFDKKKNMTQVQNGFTVSVQLEDSSSKYQTARSNLLTSLPKNCTPQDALSSVHHCSQRDQSSKCSYTRETGTKWKTNIKLQTEEQTRDLRREIQMLKSNNKRLSRVQDKIRLRTNQKEVLYNNNFSKNYFTNRKRGRKYRINSLLVLISFQGLMRLL